jgi:hypothetical protein
MGGHPAQGFFLDDAFPMLFTEQVRSFTRQFRKRKDKKKLSDAVVTTLALSFYREL